MNSSRNDPCWCGSGKKWKKCHYPQMPTTSLAEKYFKQYGIVLKTPEQIEGIRRACRITAEILDELCKHARAGVTTQELDDLSQKLHKERGVIPAPLHYGHPPYPKTICTSLNEVICHGIPDSRPLQNGDIMNIDVSCIWKGYYGECLRLAIEICKPGAFIWQIGEAIETYAAKQGCSVVNQFVGHGLGLAFHEAPEIPHHYNDVNIEMVPGMTFTIEPMINAGVREAVIDPIDGWTARTRDGRPSAQWEHTLLITESRCEILTLLDK